MPTPYRSRTAKRRNASRFRRRIGLVAALLIIIGLIPALTVHAATLSSTSVTVADPRPNSTSNYTFTASNVTIGGPGLIRCIKLVYADTATGSNVPTNMITNGGGTTLDTVGTTFVPTPASWTLNKPANGTLTLTNAAGETPASTTTRHLSINGITNSSVSDTKFWLRLNTYSNIDCATGPVDSTSILFILTNSSTLSLTVDQTLSFSVNPVASGQACDGVTTTAASTSTTIPFGTVTPASNAIVCQDLTAATNATNGYTVSARYTAPPTNTLAQTIANIPGTNQTPGAFTAAGVEGYGYSTNDASLTNCGGLCTANRFTSPTPGWAAMGLSNAEVGYEAAGVNSTTYRVAHQVGVSTLTRPGTYTTTIIYTCTPVF